MGANAQTTVPKFTAGQVLTAAQQTGINTGIPVFATTTTRDAAFGGSNKVLAEGQFAYIEASDTTQYYNGTSWQSVSSSKFGQIVSTNKVDTFTTTSTTFVDVTGLSATITPTSASSTVMVMLVVKWAETTPSGSVLGQLLRGSTSIGGGTAVGSRTPAIFGNCATQNGADASTTIFIDTPATTAATTYKVQVRSGSGANTFYLNSSSDDVDNSIRPRLASTLTLIEILP